MAGWKACGTAVCDVCDVCGRTFAKSARNQKHCSPECKKKFDGEAKRKRKEEAK